RKNIFCSIDISVMDKIIVSQSYALGNLNQPSKAGGIAVAIFSSPLTPQTQKPTFLLYRQLVLL
ncbi:MAG: hypothetical protein IIY78_04350, partial [Clostridia bacterium]|nr:hypothetical protein [Clostridia bacterium]